MKCPKCGYLGFETTDRCRNCQYDFSLAPSATEPDLTLQDANRLPDPTADFDLAGLARPADPGALAALDLDRLFGADTTPATALRFAPAPTPLEGPVASTDDRSADRLALPFDEAPLPATPRAARPPLAVRRTAFDIPRNRPRTTRAVRIEAALAFEGETPAELQPASGRASADDPGASQISLPSIGSRLAAGVIDLALLGAIDALVVFLTLRIAGLQSTREDLRVLPPVPFFGFLAMLAFGYMTAFTVAGGQTIGKMLLKLRVIGDDGRPVDAAGGVLRAAGCMLVPITLGLSFLPALLSSDHRALHDRFAGTRVVRQ